MAITPPPVVVVGDATADEEHAAPLRVLHIVTSLAEYNNGRRSTVVGQDRLRDVTLPVLERAVESMVAVPGWTVDVYLVLGFGPLSKDRRRLVRDALPDGVGLEIWENAVPYGYRRGGSVTEPATHALARQHRFVIADKLEHYDVFSAWEDDMGVTATQIKTFLDASARVDELRRAANDNAHPLYGALSPAQTDKLIPGFVRVEVLDRTSFRYDPASTNEIDPTTPRPEIDPADCCGGRPDASASDVALWETNVRALGLRKLPEPLGWVAFLPSVSRIDSYWSGTDGAYGKNAKRPGRDGNLFAQQAGVVATREQIHRFHKACPGGYLPPFSDGFWGDQSGLRPQNVEFWSGGYQLFGRCGLQRFLSLDPEIFSKQLLYHTADNKQRQLDRRRFVRAEDLLGQLHAVRTNAASRHAGEETKKEEKQ